LEYSPDDRGDDPDESKGTARYGPDNELIPASREDYGFIDLDSSSQFRGLRTYCFGSTVDPSARKVSAELYHVRHIGNDQVLKNS
jgi:hypothetical protein